jgi:hypothetical protein
MWWRVVSSAVAISDPPRLTSPPVMKFLVVDDLVTMRLKEIDRLLAGVGEAA